MHEKLSLYFKSNFSIKTIAQPFTAMGNLLPLHCVEQVLAVALGYWFYLLVDGGPTKW
jgi:hypothetical protein